jgi:hypothetical protein
VCVECIRNLGNTRLASEDTYLGYLRLAIRPICYPGKGLVASLALSPFLQEIPEVANAVM